MRINEILQKYNEDLNEKEKYFIEYFDFKAKEYFKYSNDFCVLNPNVVIDLIIEELSENNNSRNLKFFKEKLGEFFKEDVILQQGYGELIKKILEHIISDKSFTLELCKKINNELKDAQYAKLCYKRLIYLLKSPNTLQDEKKEIQYLTNVLIVEFALHGYSPKKISNMLEEIFDDYKIYRDEIFSTKFPIPDNIEKGTKELKASYMDNLTISDRFKSLSKYLDKKKEKIYYIVTLKGISGKNVNIKINNVHIYNYKMFPQFKFEEENEKEQKILWSEKFKKNEIHCSICIERIDANNSIEFVKKELNNAIDVIHLYHNVECIIEADFSNYFVFNKNKELFGSGGTVEDTDEFKRDIKSLQYDYSDLKKLNKIYKKYEQNIINSNSNVSKLIKNSARYFRKGKEAKASEDKILNYWICIENLFQIEQQFPKNILSNEENDKKYNIIISVIPYFFVRKNITDLYWKYWNIFYNKVINHNYNGEIPEELLKKSQLGCTGKINLLGFIDNIDKLKVYFKNQLDIDNLEKINSLLTDKDMAKKFFKNNEKEIKEKLLLIYRLRNMIVHNAHYNITFLDYYAKQIEIISAKTLSIISSLYIDTSKNSMYELIMDRYIHNKIELEEELKTKNIYDLIKELK